MSEKIRAASIVRLQSKVHAASGGREVTAVMRVGRKEKRFVAVGTSVPRALASLEENIRAKGYDLDALGPTHYELDLIDDLPF